MAAAALLRSATRRSRTSMVSSAAAVVRSPTPRLLFQGGLRRRPDLLPPVVTLTPARLCSSANPGSPNENPLPGDKNKEVPASSRDKELLPMWQLERKIVEKQGELLRLLLQMDVAEGSSLSSDRNKCVEVEEKEQLVRLLREFQARARRNEAQDDPVASFVCFFVLVVIVRAVILWIIDA